MKPFTIFTPVQLGLEEITESHLKELDIKITEKIKGGFYFSGHWNTIFKLNCFVKTLSRVYIRFAEFEVYYFNELRRILSEFDFSEVLTVPNICIKVYSFRSKLYHETAIRDIFFDEFVKQSGNSGLKLVGTVEDNDVQLILVTLEENVLRISFDTSGVHLHKRGYLTYRGEAPIRETIVSAMYYVLKTENFDLLCDPCCGSGTIPIEFLANSGNYSLSNHRQFSFMNWKSYDQEYWAKFNNDNILKTTIPKFKALGFDLNEKNIEISGLNSQNSKLDQYCQFEQKNIFDLEIDTLSEKQSMIIVTNPPWGKRFHPIDIRKIFRQLEKFSHFNIPVYCIIPEEHQRYFSNRTTLLFSVKVANQKLVFIKL